MKTFLNILKQFFIKKRSRVLIKKIYRRFSLISKKNKKSNKWLTENEINLDDFLKKIDLNLWNESKVFENKIKK